MVPIPRLSVLLLVLGVLALAGCKERPPQSREITSLERKQAASLASEAEFAVALRDFSRGAELYAQAAALAHDSGDLWLSLGNCQRRLGKKDEAKKSYEKALEVYRAAYTKEPETPELLIQQVYSLALLGRVDEARKVLERAHKEHPTHPQVRALTTQALNEILANENFKAMAL